jgi:RHS repeat-associated protein
LEERVYAQQDGNWDVTSIYDLGTSSIPERFSYSPYGGYVNLNGSWATFTDNGWNWVMKFQGERYEGTGGFYFSGLRLWSVALGRWMQPDPAGYIDSNNLYVAEGDNTAGTVDPMGMFGFWSEGLSKSAQWAMYIGTEGINYSINIFGKASFGITITNDGQSIPSPAFAMGPGHAPGTAVGTSQAGAWWDGFSEAFMDGEAADGAGGYLSQLAQDAGLVGPTDTGPFFGNQEAFDAGKGIGRDAEKAAAIAAMVAAPFTAFESAAGLAGLIGGTADAGGAVALSGAGATAVQAVGAAVGAGQFAAGAALYKHWEPLFSPDSGGGSGGQFRRRKPGLGRQRASGVPSWAEGRAPYIGENGKGFAHRLCTEKYGAGNYPTHPGSEFSQIKKFGDRGFEK